MRRETRAGKTLVPLLGVLAILSMGVAAVAIVLQMQEREKRQAKERELHLALAENDDLKARLDELEQAKTRVEEELTRARQELVQSQDELTKAVEARETLARSLEDREQEIGRLTKDVEQVRNDAKQAATQLNELQAERETMRQQVTDLERAKGELESKIMELSERPTVELDKVVVSSDPFAMAQPPPIGAGMPGGASAGPLEGQVVVINREYDFIVMNLGKNQGLSVGQEFQIVRGDQVLGRAKVEKVYDELSAAGLLPESKKNEIREGDSVRAL